MTAWKECKPGEKYCHTDSRFLTESQKNKTGKSLDFPNPCGNIKEMKMVLRLRSATDDFEQNLVGERSRTDTLRKIEWKSGKNIS